MIENVSTQLTVFHCFAHCLLPGRAFASLYALLFLEKEAEIGGRDHGEYVFTDQIRLVVFCIRQHIDHIRKFNLNSDQLFQS